MISTVVGYGGHRSYGYPLLYYLIFMCRDKPYSKLKPGQSTLERDYYAKANQEVPDGRVTLKNFNRFDTNYRENIAQTVTPSDYKVPSKNQNTMSIISILLTIFL